MIPPHTRVTVSVLPDSNGSSETGNQVTPRSYRWSLVVGRWQNRMVSSGSWSKGLRDAGCGTKMVLEGPGIEYPQK